MHACTIGLEPWIKTNPLILNAKSHAHDKNVHYDEQSPSMTSSQFINDLSHMLHAPGAWSTPTTLITTGQLNGNTLQWGRTSWYSWCELQNQTCVCSHWLHWVRMHCNLFNAKGTHLVWPSANKPVHKHVLQPFHTLINEYMQQGAGQGPHATES